MREYDVTATFFPVTSEEHADYFYLFEQAEKDGHTIGMHSHSHSYSKIYDSPTAFWEDIEVQKSILAQYISVIPSVLRFPGGSSNTVSRNYGGSDIMEVLKLEANAQGYVIIDWNVSAEDATGEDINSTTITQNVLSGAKKKNTATILLHDSKNNKETAEALPAIIEGLLNLGFEIRDKDSPIEE